MRTLRNAILAGVAALALAATPGLARAQNSPTPHVMTIQLPDGGVARIQYAGDVPPRVMFAPQATMAMPMPFMPAAFGPDSPFAMLERMSAAMDREAAALMQQAGAMFAAPMAPMAPMPPMPPMPGALVPAGFGAAPLGSEAFSFASSTNGPGMCIRSMTITSTGPGAPPHVVRRQSGDCGHAGGPAAPAFERIAPAQARPGNTIRVRYDGGQPPSSLIRPIPPAWQG